MGDRKREIFDFNRSMRNYTTKKNELCELIFDFTIENIKVCNKLEISVASAGNIEAPVYFVDVKIYKRI